MISAAKAQFASKVDPDSIESRAPLGAGAELLVRNRPPGSVNLTHGQREHVLMCTFGSPVEGHAVRSVLHTEIGRREWQSCPKGHMTFLPSGIPLEWSWSYKSQSVHLTMPPSFLENVSAEFEKQDGDRIQLKPMFRVFDNNLTSLLHQLRGEVFKEDIGSDLVTSSLLQLIAVQLYRTSDPLPVTSRVKQDTPRFSAKDCRRCVEILNDRLAEKITLSELAAQFNLSPFHFARVFKREIGMPPHEYQLQLRIARARELLRRTPRRTIADIAFELGFFDESHFRRHFRRIVGATPGEFRAQQ